MVVEMKSRLDKTLQKQYNPSGNDLAKSMKKEGASGESQKKQEISISRPIDS